MSDLEFGDEEGVASIECDSDEASQYAEDDGDDSGGDEGDEFGGEDDGDDPNVSDPATDLEEEIGNEDPERFPDPEEGMEFNTENEVMHFYDEHSHNVGFEWRIQERSSTRRNTDEIDKLRLWCVCRGVFKSRSENPQRATSSCRTGCKAGLNAHRREDSDKWTITKVVLEHNHGLDVENRRLKTSVRAISPEEERLLRLTALAGIPICKAYALLAMIKGGIGNIGFSERDARNRLNRIRRKQMEGGDYAAMVRFMERMAREDPDFYGASDIDEEGRCRNVFWADGRSREAYKDFGDIISFDATYSKNRYGMPFCPFVGVNHHGQTILLGCALVTSESTRDFVWVFEQWLKCMGGKAPAGIITDQSRAIGEVFKLVLTNRMFYNCDVDFKFLTYNYLNCGYVSVGTV